MNKQSWRKGIHFGIHNFGQDAQNYLLLTTPQSNFLSSRESTTNIPFSLPAYQLITIRIKNHSHACEKIGCLSRKV